MKNKETLETKRLFTREKNDKHKKNSPLPLQIQDLSRLLQTPRHPPLEVMG